MILIPAIDLRGGHCVRLLHGDFSEETRYDAEPHALLARYRRLGAGWLHVVDLDGARADGPDQRDLIAGLAAQHPQLQVGGGLRDIAALKRVFDAGIGRAVVGSAAVTQVDTVRGWLREFGAARIVLAFDVRLDDEGNPRVAIHGWREQSRLSLWDAVEKYLQFGVQHVLCTDVGRDGALTGPNVDLYAEAVRRHPRIEWQASGGIRDARDLRALAATGVAAAISGKALLEERIAREDLQSFLPNA